MKVENDIGGVRNRSYGGEGRVNTDLTSLHSLIPAVHDVNIMLRLRAYAKALFPINVSCRAVSL